MDTSTLQALLAGNSPATRAAVRTRIVVRRFDALLGDVERSLRDRTLQVAAPPVCELVAGETTLARGEITEENGHAVFRVTEVLA